MQISSSSLTFGNGTLSQVVSDAANVRRQLDVLTRQAGDGLISDTYSGLGAEAAVSLSLGSSLDQVKTWQANTQAAAGQMQTAQSALSQINDIASHFFAETAALNGVNATAIDATAASARDALTQMAGLLNSKFGDTYVFSGTDSAAPPIPGDILVSGMVTSIAAAVGALAANGGAATVTSTLTVAASNAPGVSPFSSILSQPATSLQGARTMVSVGPGAPTPTGMLASTNADVASNGSSTTGSYIRDIMRALATIGALSGSQATAPGLGVLVQDIHTSLGDAISALNGDAGVMGNRQASLEARHQNLGDTVASVEGQISNVQDVDMAATLSRLTATQTQLQASYQLLGTLRSLSLASVLAGGG
jgi:flagellar hook-associated protein 3 FlgL